MVDPDGMQRHFRTAMEEVFASADIVYLFKGCFTLRKFALNKTFVEFARKKQVDIAVAVRANIDPLLYQFAVYGRIPFKVCDIQWPKTLDPTFDPLTTFDIMQYFVDPHAVVQSHIQNILELLIMTKMLDSNAPHVRRLEISMTMGLEWSDATQSEERCSHIKKFLAALAKCTAMETLIITQTDHVARDANLTTVQCKVFDIIKTMHHLKVLDFCGNMTLDATNATLDPTNGTQNQLTMIDYLPPSLSELIIRDGPVPRMYKWREFYGFPAGLKLAMSNDTGRFPLLKSISLPSSFWSLMPHEFGGFVLHLNTKHVTNIGFSDPFKLDQGPSRPAEGYGHFTYLPKPKYGLHYLIATLDNDMVIDIRGGDDAERAERIQWAMDITTSGVQLPVLRADGQDHTTITLHKKDSSTVKLLI